MGLGEGLGEGEGDGGDDLTQRGQVAGLDALRGAATYALDEKTGAPRMNARTLSVRLFAGEALPPRAREALERLPSRLRQSVREHAGQSLMSYVALADAWLNESPSSRGGAPQFPRRRRVTDMQAQRMETLAELATLADDRRRERALITKLLTTREPAAPAIPFVGVADDYGCGLYYNAETAGFYARLDILSPRSRYATGPLTMRGVYTQIKTGERWASETQLQAMQARGETTEGIRSFGRGRGRIWLPLKLDEPTGTQTASYHRRPLRFTHAAYLPQFTSATGDTGATGETGATGAILPADPVSAKLVRHATGSATGVKIWYQLHVSFAVPPEALESAAADGLTPEQRPLLAINRGLRHLYAAALLTPDGRRELAAFAAGGDELLARQATLEQTRARLQQRGAAAAHGAWSTRDRRQSRVAGHEIHVCANQIVEVARRERAQVVMEDLERFATGAAIRATTHQPRALGTAFRALLGRRQFEALHTAIDARLALVGLPPARVVSAATISQTCTQCGTRDTRAYAERMAAQVAAGETPDSRLFICPQCGLERDVDALAAVNIGRKLVWLRQRGVEKKAGVADGARTSWEDWVRHLCGTQA